MKTIIFNKAIEDEPVSNLIKEIDAVKLEGNEELKIFFSSQGGTWHTALTLIEYLNTCGKNIVIYPVYTVNSCAIDVIVRSDNIKKVFIDQTLVCCIHLLNNKYNSIELLDKTSYEYFDNLVLEDFNNKQIEFLRLFNVFTDEELKEMKKGKDIYFGADTLEKLIDGYNTQAKEKEAAVMQA